MDFVSIYLESYICWINWMKIINILPYLNQTLSHGQYMIDCNLKIRGNCSEGRVIACAVQSHIYAHMFVCVHARCLVCRQCLRCL